MLRSAALLLISSGCLEVAQQRVPSCEGVADSSGEPALVLADPFQGALEELLQLVQSRPGVLTRAARRRSGACPRTLVSMTNRAAMRSIASRAIGEAEAWWIKPQNFRRT